MLHRPKRGVKMTDRFNPYDYVCPRCMGKGWLNITVVREYAVVGERMMRRFQDSDTMTCPKCYGCGRWSPTVDEMYSD